MKSTIRLLGENPVQTNFNVRSLNVTVTDQEVEDGTNMTTGLHVGDLDVEYHDGQYTRFHVYLRINKQGRAVAEISTNNKEGTRSTVKSVTGTKRYGLSLRGRVD